jgi:hypothetical protein
MYWVVLLVVGLGALGGLFHVSQRRAFERRAFELEVDFSRRVAELEESLANATDELRRAHVRLDNHQRELGALARDIGWSDDRAHTRVLTAPIPPMAKKPIE